MGEDAMPTQIVIYGAGDHGLVVAEAAELAGWRVRGLHDEQFPPNTELGRWRVVEASETDAFALALADNTARLQAAVRLAEAGIRLVTVVHPAATVSPSAHLGDGAFIGPQAVVQTNALVGMAAIVNSAATVEHHGHVQSGAHVGSAAVLGSRAHVGQRTRLGNGSVVLPGVTIGNDATIGAGSIVLHDVADGQTLIGDPARPVI